MPGSPTSSQAVDWISYKIQDFLRKDHLPNKAIRQLPYPESFLLALR